MAVLQPGRDFAWFPLGNDISLSAWRRLLLFRTHCAGRSHDSAITTPRFVVRKFPVIARPIWLSSFWTSSLRFFTPAPSRSSHHNSAPYNAVAYTHATSAFLQAPVQSPACPVRRRIRPIAFRADFILAEWCSLRVILESIQTPSHRVACLLKGIRSSPTGTVSVGFFRRFDKNMASVLARSKVRSVHTCGRG